MIFCKSLFFFHNKVLLVAALPFFFSLPLNTLRARLVRKVKKWEDGKLWEDEKYLVFPLMCSVEKVEKWKGEKLFYLVGEKKGRMKNVIYIN